jgi:hypothetical protein
MSKKTTRSDSKNAKKNVPAPTTPAPTFAVETPTDNSASLPASNVVDFPKSETVNPNSGETPMTITLTRSTKVTKSKAIRFVSDAIRGNVRIPASAFATVPDSLTIEVPEGALAPVTGTGVSKAKMTPEERKTAAATEKARRAALTPEARAAEDRVKVEARAAKLAKQLAATNAKLGV